MIKISTPYAEYTNDLKMIYLTLFVCDVLKFVESIIVNGTCVPVENF